MSVPFVNIIFIFKHAALHDAHEDTRHNDQHGEDAQHNHQHLRYEFPATLGCQRMSLENFRFVRSLISVVAARVMMGSIRTASRPIAIVHFTVVLVSSPSYIYNKVKPNVFLCLCIMLKAMLQRYIFTPNHSNISLILTKFILSPHPRFLLSSFYRFPSVSP